MANTFRLDIARFLNKLDHALPEIQEEISLDMREDVASRTPTNTGRARASWNANLGSPNERVQPESYNNPNAALQDGEKNVEGSVLGSTIYISNSIDYIGELNSGTSSKAPAGFVEATLSGVPVFVAKAAKSIRSKFRI